MLGGVRLLTQVCHRCVGPHKRVRSGSQGFSAEHLQYSAWQVLEDMSLFRWKWCFCLAGWNWCNACLSCFVKVTMVVFSGLAVPGTLRDKATIGLQAKWPIIMHEEVLM